MVKLIVCIDKDGNIGLNNELLFNIKEDMQFFKEQTTNNLVIMGHNTFLSLGKRPLPNRFNLVITTDEIEPAKNLARVENLAKTVRQYNENKIRKDLYIIGGAKVYNTAIRKKLADELLITVVHERAKEADTSIDMKIVRQNYKKAETIKTIKDGERKAAIERWIKK